MSAEVDISKSSVADKKGATNMLQSNEESACADQNKSRRRIHWVIGFLVFSMAIVVLADSLGVYFCNSCSPSDPFDEVTQGFINDDVKSDIANWYSGDHVLIVNIDTGDVGVWGRASAFGPVQYLGIPSVFGYHNNGDNGGGGSGGGGGSSGGGSGSGGWGWMPGGPPPATAHVRRR